MVDHGGLRDPGRACPATSGFRSLGSSPQSPPAPSYGAEALQALERLDRGVVFVDPWVRMLHLNREARRLLEQGHGLRGKDGCLVCDCREDAIALHRLVGLAAAGTLDRYGAPLPVRRGPERRPLAVHVSPLVPDPSLAPLCSTAVAMVLVRDVEMPAGSAAATLSRLYGLTTAEARVAEALLSHERLAQVAAALGVSLPTVRTLLQRAFDKTGTHRQVDLVRLMLTHNTAAVAPVTGHRIKDLDPTRV